MLLSIERGRRDCAARSAHACGARSDATLRQAPRPRQSAADAAGPLKLWQKRHESASYPHRQLIRRGSSKCSPFTDVNTDSAAGLWSEVSGRHAHQLIVLRRSHRLTGTVHAVDEPSAHGCLRLARPVFVCPRAVGVTGRSAAPMRLTEASGWYIPARADAPFSPSGRIHRRIA